MPKTLVIRVQSKSGRHVVNSLYPDSKLSELQKVLQEKTSCPPTCQKILIGYPPHEIDSYSPSYTLLSLRIRSGDSIIMEELPPNKIKTEGGHCVSIKRAGSITSPPSACPGPSEPPSGSASSSYSVAKIYQPSFGLLPQSGHRSSGTKMKGIFTLASFGDSAADSILPLHEQRMKVLSERDMTEMRGLDPTKVTDIFWIWAKPPNPDNTPSCGKWLVFQPKTIIDKSWHAIRRAVEAGEFGPGCTAAKCATNREHPEKPKTTQGVFMLYTTEESIDEVGMILVHKVKQTIRYKKNEDTVAGRYAHRGDKGITCKTIFWNGGKPSFEKLKK